jgi:uncharacterized protein
VVICFDSASIAAANSDLRRKKMNPHRAFTALRSAATLVFALGVVSLAAPKPAVVGNWTGVLDAGPQTKLHLAVHITQTKDGSLTGTMDSLDQNANGIPITTITYKAGALHFECSSIGGSYDGKMSSDKSKISGTWPQGGGSLALNLTRSSK